MISDTVKRKNMIVDYKFSKSSISFIEKTYLYFFILLFKLCERENEQINKIMINFLINFLILNSNA